MAYTKDKFFGWWWKYNRTISIGSSWLDGTVIETIISKICILCNATVL
jgi:hypothetical protein